MKKIYIYFSEDNELCDWESLNKGYRIDVYAKIDDSIFQLSVYDIVRLQQDFNSELEDLGYYSIDSNLVLVKEVNKKEIIFTIENLFLQGYFDKLKPLENMITNQLTLIQIN